MNLYTTVKCRIVLADGFQVNGKLNISNRWEFMRYLSKKKIAKPSDEIDDIIFESMVLTNVGARKKI